MNDDLETQVAKIQIGDPRQATAYVYILAEKIDATDTEIYVLCELPLFNPAALADCERISDAIAASLKRSYRQTANDNTFENALAQINEELGKLAAMGKTNWVGKLSALVAAKRGASLSIATVGKITALLYRGDNFMAVSESTPTTSPLKTFENFAVGKLRLDDLLVFSTTQLLNHISIDRIKQILEDDDLPQAAGAMIEILRENAGPEIACGTILALQVEPGQGRDEEIDLSAYIDAPAGKQSGGTFSAAGLAGLASSAKNLPKAIIQKSQGFITKAIGRFRNQPKPSVRGLLNKNKAAIGVVNQQFRKATQQLRPQTFRGFSNTKKFFFISAAILLVALIASIAVTQHYRQTKVADSATRASVAGLQKLANDANAAIIYGDRAKARDLLTQVETGLSNQKTSDKTTQSQLDAIKQQVADLENKLNNVTTVQPEQVATLGNADHLIVLPDYLATETQRTIVSWNRKTSSVQDNALHTSEPVVFSAFTKGSQAAIYNGKELFLWNYQTGQLGQAFSDSVAQDKMTGLKLYPANNRVYSIDKANNRVVSFLVSDKDISKPVIAVQNAGDLTAASDLAIDGNIYILINGGINKYNSGKQQDFHPALPSPLSGTARAYAQPDYKNIYILDSGNKRILILDKQGGLVKTLVSPQLSSMKDFAVDEKNKTIYILSGNSLLKVKF